MDEPVVEIATDKVDSEVPSEVEGVLIEKLFEADDVVQVGQTIAIIEIDGDSSNEQADSATEEESLTTEQPEEKQTETSADQAAQLVNTAKETVGASAISNDGDRFYSPLVKNIAQQEGIDQEELDKISGTGLEGRVTKDDIIKYVETRKSGKAPVTEAKPEPTKVPEKAALSISRLLSHQLL